MSLKIKDLPINERPRERLLNNGAEKLSNEELLAIILKTGTNGQSAKLLATEIMSKIKNIRDLKEINYQQIEKIKGIGPSKAATILATLELANRLNKSHDNIIKLKITNSQIVYEYYRDNLVNLKQEYFYCLYLDASKKVIKDKLLFVGTINYSVVHPREIYKEAYLISAAAIICVHNHPSGSLEPSNEDKLLTKRLIEIGHTFGIPIIDHIIIGNDGYYSFFENGSI